MEQLKNLFSSDEKVIDTPIMKVKGNVLAFNDYFLQISNISQVSIAPGSKRNYPVSAIAAVLGGLLIISLKSFIAILIGLMVAGFGGYMLYNTYTKNSNSGENMVIHLNSGSIFYINFKERTFLNKVMEVLKDCSNSSKSNYVIDVKNSVITVGDENKIEFKQA
ncbi:hypothetical protein QE109_13980 [Fusibacter bizertensis]|uniref:Uncharacterized protein n=1 Tax=Fusibacter bizertensis TaxID=1488331 RepID=A0ABT6NFU1_9FIRM|nr:hypothetical protein [Fusibacter bizertensis]MDH8679262.1 hypothetical protein [Fusibacter bizertensis]